uniref:Uncharacterized protein n=1 Tax=Acrobeloides nanus TaxID=290746 RepID=A0A914EAQ9_9BILA
MAVDAVSFLGDNLPLNMIVIKKINCGSLPDSKLIKAEHYKNPSIALLNIELELKEEKDNAELRFANVSDYQQFSNFLRTQVP